MTVELGIGAGAAALVGGFPLFLLGVMWLLGFLEAWMLQRDERAAAVQELLERTDAAEEVEAEVIRIVAEVADRPNRISASGPRRERTAG